MPISVTSRLATFAADLSCAAIPPSIRDKIKLHLLDAVGCAIAAGNCSDLQRIDDFSRREYAEGSCRLIGRRHALGPVGAAFFNSAAINALDYDDGYELAGRGLGHPGATLVAAALAGLCDAAPSGAELIAALTAAYEINGRVILAIQPSDERFREVYGVCQHQALGAAVAYGRLHRLSAEGLENALGLAGTLAPLPSLRKYNWETRPLVSFKDFNAPAAEAGVRAVRLHQQGLVGARDVLGGSHGFWRMIGSDRCAEEGLSAGLGTQWRTEHASFKAYPACRWVHCALESLESVVATHDIAGSRIARIEIRTSATLLADFMDARPANMIDAQFSLPYGAACLALRVPKADWQRPETRADGEVIALMARVRATIDSEFDTAMRNERRPSGQALVYADDQVYAGPRLHFPLGCQERPLGEAQIVEKFRRLCAGHVAPSVAENFIAAILSLEDAADARRVFAPLWP